MRFPVFLDTNVLYPTSLADTPLRLAESDGIRPCWSVDVMIELERNLARRVTPEKASRRCRTTKAAFPEAMVSGYEGIVGGMGNDPKDRHVLAAAVHSDCEVIVTFNTKDFPRVALAPTISLQCTRTTFYWISWICIRRRPGDPLNAGPLKLHGRSSHCSS